MKKIRNKDTSCVHLQCSWKRYISYDDEKAKILSCKRTNFSFCICIDKEHYDDHGQIIHISPNDSEIRDVFPKRISLMISKYFCGVWWGRVKPWTLIGGSTISVGGLGSPLEPLMECEGELGEPMAVCCTRVQAPSPDNPCQIWNWQYPRTLFLQCWWWH